MEFIRIGDRAYYRFTADEVIARQNFEQSILKSDMVQTLIDNLINMMVIAEQDAKRSWISIKENLANDLGIDSDELEEVQKELSYEWVKGGLEINSETFALYEQQKLLKQEQLSNTFELGK